jgi:TRAP-type C4-dicarboxylate transport system permease small subunit
MSVEVDKDALTPPVEAVVKILTNIAAWALAAMMFLTFVDVVLRYFFNSPIQGAGELIEFMMAIVVPFSIVYCARLKAHIAVDFITESLPKSVRNVIDTINSVLMLGLFVLITYQSYFYLIDEFESGLTSPVLYIPTYPFVAMVSLAFFALTLVLIEQFVRSLVEIVK